MTRIIMAGPSSPSNTPAVQLETTINDPCTVQSMGQLQQIISNVRVDPDRDYQSNLLSQFEVGRLSAYLPLIGTKSWDGSSQILWKFCILRISSFNVVSFSFLRIRIPRNIIRPFDPFAQDPQYCGYPEFGRHNISFSESFHKFHVPLPSINHIGLLPLVSRLGGIHENAVRSVIPVPDVSVNILCIYHSA